MLEQTIGNDMLGVILLQDWPGKSPSELNGQVHSWISNHKTFQASSVSEFREYLYRYLPGLGEGWVIRVKGSGKVNCLTDFIAEVFIFGLALTMVAWIHSQDEISGAACVAGDEANAFRYPTRCRYRVPCSVWHVKQEFQHQKKQKNWFAAYTDIIFSWDISIHAFIWIDMNWYELWFDIDISKGCQHSRISWHRLNLGSQVSRSMRLLKDWSPFTSSPSCTSKRLWCCLTQSRKQNWRESPWIWNRCQGDLFIAFIRFSNFHLRWFLVMQKGEDGEELFSALARCKWWVGRGWGDCQHHQTISKCRSDSFRTVGCLINECLWATPWSICCLLVLRDSSLFFHVLCPFGHKTQASGQLLLRCLSEHHGCLGLIARGKQPSSCSSYPFLFCHCYPCCLCCPCCPCYSQCPYVPLVSVVLGAVGAGGSGGGCWRWCSCREGR